MNRYSFFIFALMCLIPCAIHSHSINGDWDTVGAVLYGFGTLMNAIGFSIPRAKKETKP